jgi:hypothetical protein
MHQAGQPAFRETGNGKRAGRKTCAPSFSVLRFPFSVFRRSGAHGAANYTPHVPPKPMVTLPPSTMTGTRRSPEMRTIRSSSFLFSLTLM